MGNDSPRIPHIRPVKVIRARLEDQDLEGRLCGSLIGKPVDVSACTAVTGG